jgi:hypothetical protein
MKKQLIVALGLAVLATPAFATKARLEALGEDNFGSYYIQDNRNIFLNPATINNHKDFVTYELGSSANNTTGAGFDRAGAPRAEGGVVKSIGNMVYGLNFGNSTPTAGVTRTLGGIDNAQEVNPVDVFVGGDAGVKWGASLTYEGFDGTAGGDRISSNALRARVGGIMGDLEAFALVSLMGDVKNRTDALEVEGQNSYFAGVGYLWNNYKFFADYKDVGADYGAQGGSLNSWEFNEIRVGVGRAERLNDRATLFAKAMVVRTTIEDETNANAGNLVPSVDGEITSTVLPLTVGLEYDATTWLQLRASVIHNIWGTREIDTTATTNSSVAATSVRAGASLKFGEFSVDGLVSTTASGDATGTATNPSIDTTAGNGALRTDALMTRVSFIYNF